MPDTVTVVSATDWICGNGKPRARRSIMLPDPLHPIVVHFPIVLVVLLPVFALGALLVIRRGAAPRPVWALPLAVTAALTLSAWVAIQTGEREEDRVERIVGEAALHTHEEAAERFLVLSAVLLVVTSVGLVGGTVGAAARLVTTAGSLGLVLAGIQVGGSGGDLVYRHGAASAYVQGATAEPWGGETSAPLARQRPARDDD
jgi:uncharacterized membrane protein